MNGSDGEFGGRGKELRTAIEGIEAALEAALGASGGSKSELARRALTNQANEPELERWLESIAAELQSSGSALVPDETVDLVARRILSGGSKSLGAHGRVRRSVVSALTRKD